MLKINIAQPLMGGRLPLVWRLLKENGIGFHPLHIVRALLSVMVSACLTTPLGWLEKQLYNNLITLKNQRPPVFIIGHWRSGTTFLHYLLSQDQQFATMSNAEAMAPNNMHVGHWLMRLFAQVFLPKKRPMDDVKLNARFPQEEEFALCQLDAGGAYLGWYFPQRLSYFFEKYTLPEKMGQAERTRFSEQYKALVLKAMGKHRGRRLLLKDPVNTGRIQLLLQLFPDAQFIYLHRNPREVQLSSLRLHRRMIEFLGFQNCPNEAVEKMVPELYGKVMKTYAATRSLIPKGQLIEMKYEDLTAAPLSSVANIYQRLGWSGYQAAEPAFAAYLEAEKDYRPADYSPQGKEQENRAYLPDLQWQTGA